MTTLTSKTGFMAVTGAEPAEGAVFVRPSAHATWQMCPAAVAFTSHPEYDNTSSMQAARGTGVHLLNEMVISIGNAPNTVDDVLAVWMGEMRSRDEDISGLASRSRLFQIAAEILHAHNQWVDQFWTPVGQHLDILAVEERMRMPLGVAPSGREIWLRGTADLVTHGKVWDWKTASAGWSNSKLKEMTQHLFYAAMAEREHDMFVHEAAYVVFNFKTGRWEWDQFTVDVNPSKIQLALYEMYKMGVVIDADAAMCSPAKRGASWGQDGRGWWCSPKWCGAWNICEGKSLLDDGQADVKRDNTITWK